MSKIIYYDGLNHLDRKRTKLVAVKLNEPELVVLSNLQHVLDQPNFSDLIRALIFRAIHTLTEEEQTALREMVKQSTLNNQLSTINYPRLCRSFEALPK